MAAAALTPRVRILVVCDEVAPSEIEDGVYTLEGIRQHVSAGGFPYNRDLELYLLLSCPRPATYDGWVSVTHPSSAKIIRYREFRVSFEISNELLDVSVKVDHCVFRNPGEYAVEVWFRDRNGKAAQKGELPFHVFAEYEE